MTRHRPSEWLCTCLAPSTCKDEKGAQHSSEWTKSELCTARTRYGLAQSVLFILSRRGAVMHADARRLATVPPYQCAGLCSPCDAVCGLRATWVYTEAALASGIAPWRILAGAMA